MASSTRSRFGLALVGALAIVGAAALVGSAHSFFVPVTLRPDWSKNSGAGRPDRPVPVDPASTEPAATEPGDGVSPPEQPLPQGDGPYIDLPAAVQMFEEGAVFLDARPREEYDKAHVLGAQHLTAELISSGKARDAIGELVNNYGYEQRIVIYCHGGDCDASDNVAKLLLAMGFNNLRVMKGGFDGWQAAGNEVE